MATNNFAGLVQSVTDARLNIQSIKGELYAAKEGLKVSQQKIDSAKQTGQAYDSLVAENKAFGSMIQQKQSSLQGAFATETDLMGQISRLFPTYETLVSNLNDRIPVLFFPVRIETIFKKDTPSTGQYQLWVRIFPDDIAVDTHEPDLTDNEITEGQQYWTAVTTNSATDADRLQAWDVLCRSFTHERAAWVALQTTPIDPNASPLVFPALTAKSSSWTKQPEVRILPDAFGVYCYTSYDSAATATLGTSIMGKRIPDVVKIGIDPNSLSPTSDSFTFDNTSGDLVTNDPDVDWMLDFDAAVNKGLGVKINITSSQYNSGFKRIVVLGVKYSMDANTSQERLEELWNSHHYTDGFSLLEQGTSTNNTETEYSGYGMKDFSNATTNDTEIREQFTPSSTLQNKTDGQLFCEALGIEYDPLKHIYHSGGYDVRDAMYMNNILYPATWGYYATNLLYPLVSQSQASQLRSFFSDYVRSRGALPSIRTGTQPYGLLPATVHSRMNWSNDPSAGINQNIWNITTRMSPYWDNALSFMASSGVHAGQSLMNVFTQNSTSTEYVQRVAMGPGYVWNSLAYASATHGREALKNDWYNQKFAAITNLKEALQFNFTTTPRVLGLTTLENHSSVSIPAIAPDIFNVNDTLPDIGGGHNFLSLLGKASYTEIRDENYNNYGVDELRHNDTMLYKFSRQSMLLEYHEIACNILNLPLAQRVDPEFVNFPSNAFGSKGEGLSNSGPMQMPIISGTSRWKVLESPYQGFPTMGEYIDSGRLGSSALLTNLTTMRESFASLASNSIRQLDTLFRGVFDSATFRLDIWRLALVNQRINVLRGITNGSESRNMGIYLGAYGWVEDVKPKSKTIGTAPTSNFTSSSTNPIYIDSTNEGFIHAPSINQAITGAVLRSGYINRADSNNTSPLSVNISSERVRGALEILEGIRNGQEIAVLLGYEFERRIHELYPVTYELDKYIQPLRDVYSLNNTIPATTPVGISNIKSKNVVNGVALLKKYKDNYSSSAPTQGMNAVFLNIPNNLLPLSSNAYTAFEAEINWISNLMDAVGDISTTEGMFHIVQGNPVKAGAIMDGISKGNAMPDPDVIDTPKTGIAVTQRYTMHFADSSAIFGWGANETPRSKAEPYLNNWIGQLLGDPNMIACSIYVDSIDTTTYFTPSLLEIQPIDFLYLCNDNLVDDDSLLSLMIRQKLRDMWGLDDSAVLKINYSVFIDQSYKSFMEVLPIIKYAKRLITSCRPLDTFDYLVPTDMDGAVKEYEVNNFYNKIEMLINDFHTAVDNLTASITSNDYSTMMSALTQINLYGFGQTVYEFINDTTAEQLDVIIGMLQSVNVDAGDRWKQIQSIQTSPGFVLPNTVEEQPAFIQTGLDIVKIMFGNGFVMLPQFKIRAQEKGILMNTYYGASNYDTLLADHNEYVVDEWTSSIAKVRKNAGNYEMLSALATTVNVDSFTNNRKVKAFQLPFDNTTGYERWLGASVSDSDHSLLEGRVSYGISLPFDSVIDFSEDYHVGIMIEEWLDVIPNKEESTGIAFQQDQPNAKPPQCLILGLTPTITGNWQWADMLAMINETFDIAKQRAVDYETITATPNTPWAQFGSAVAVPISTSIGAAISFANFNL